MTGRPRKASAATPKPQAGVTGRKTLPMARGTPKNKATEEPEEKKEESGKKAKKGLRCQTPMQVDQDSQKRGRDRLPSSGRGVSQTVKEAGG